MSDLFIEMEEESNRNYDEASLALPLKRSLDSFLTQTREEEHTTKKKTKSEFSFTAASFNANTLDLSKVNSFFSLKPSMIHVPILTELKTLKLEDEKMDHSESLVDQGVLKEMKIARFGRIYKRKKPSKLGYQCLQKIDGYQFCKFCNANLPLSAFYVSCKRYVCRRHHYLRVRRRFLERAKEEDVLMLAYHNWHLLNGHRFWMGYDKLRYDLGDMRNIFQNLASVLPLHDIKPCLIPIDFGVPMRPRNIAAVSNEASRFVLKFLTFLPSRAFYVALVQHLNLIPPNFDVGMPENPWHDPTYKRTDIDVPALFEELKTLPVEHQDVDVVREFLERASTPWLNCKVLPAGEAGYWKDGKPIPSATQAVEVSEPQ